MPTAPTTSPAPFGPAICDHGYSYVALLANSYAELDCPTCTALRDAEWEAESAAECYAENAWLRAAEQGYPGYADDPRELALEANDPQINGDWLGA